MRLPREFRFDVGEVEVSREGDAVILRPHVKSAEKLSSFRAALQRGVSDDFLENWTR